METKEKRDPSCTRRVKRHTLELGAGHGVLAEGIRLGQDVVPKQGYVDMVLASMRFPDLSLGPYKRDSTTKPFAALRRFVMA